jgi:hypothetical protein
MDCNLTILLFQLWYSQQAADGNAPGHPLGFDGYRHFGLIKMVGAGGGGDDLPNIDVIAVGNDAAANGWMTIACLALADSVFNSLIADSNQLGYFL